MKWICKVCELKRDDRRGSGCNGVKGQSHVWVDANEYYNDKNMERVKEWIDSKNSLEWKNEYENIKKYFKESTENAQEQYVKSLKYGKVIYDKIVEYSNKYFEYKEVKNQEAIEKNQEIIKQLNKIFGRKMRLFSIFIIIVFITMLLITGSKFLSILSGIILFIIGFKIFHKKSTFNINEYVNQELEIFEANYFDEAEYKKVSGFLNGKDIEEAWEIYLKELENEYNESIKNILKKGINLIDENNIKHNVDAYYTYDNIRFYVHSIYDDYDDCDKEYGEIWGWHLEGISFKDKYINDDTFIKKYNIVSKISDWEL